MVERRWLRWRRWWELPQFHNMQTLQLKTRKMPKISFARVKRLQLVTTARVRRATMPAWVIFSDDYNSGGN